MFHPGDLGNRIYIIASGQAEVTRAENGSEQVLARLGSGEYFGEDGPSQSDDKKCHCPLH